jgi:HD-GYP domain-containing protein (c-di-GMP phosphodiesterase class II)
LFCSLANVASISIQNAELVQSLEQANIEIAEAYDSTLEGWAKALELRDMETEGHSRRVVDLSIQLAQKMGISGESLVHFQRGALLHDIGKMSVPDSILQKPGKLTDDEWKIMRQHPQYAYHWLSSIKYLQPCLDIPRYHHEKWDGSGYPHGLQGEQIPLSARIFAIVDVWDALLSDRPYRDAWSKDRAIDYIAFHSGDHFDPDVVKAFLGLVAAEKTTDD